MRASILLTQEKYVSGILKPVGMLNCKPSSTFLSTSEKLSKEEGEAWKVNDSSNNRTVIGALECVTLTRPDTSLHVNNI